MVLVLFRIARKFLHFPAPYFTGYLLDSNHRKRIQKPGNLIKWSGIRAGMRILEVGCGSGAFTTYFARAVGEKGMVYALDIQIKMLKQLENKLKRPENKDIKNIELILGSAYELPFPNNSIDLVYMITVFQEIPDKDKTLQEIKRVLKHCGKLSISEFFPDPDFPFRSTTVKQGTKGGFILDGVFGNFWNYTVRFKKPPF